MSFKKVSKKVSVSTNLVPKKVSVSVSKTFSLKKSLGIGLENIWSQKNSRYQSRMKFLVSSLSGAGSVWGDIGWYLVVMVIMVTINIMVDMVVITVVVRITRTQDRQDRQDRDERQDRQI